VCAISSLTSTFAISSPDEFLLNYGCVLRWFVFSQIFSAPSGRVCADVGWEMTMTGLRSYVHKTQNQS